MGMKFPRTMYMSAYATTGRVKEVHPVGPPPLCILADHVFLEGYDKLYQIGREVFTTRAAAEADAAKRRHTRLDQLE